MTLAALASGCDQGHQRTDPSGSGIAVVPLTLVGANVGPDQPLPANGRIELQFNRLLLPTSITRQTFVLTNAAATAPYTPTVAYDPVSRVVTVTPQADPGQALVPGQDYKLFIVSPQSPGDVNGLRAIDGAFPTPPGGATVIAFMASAPLAVAPTNPTIDFCRDIEPLLLAKCSLPACHQGGSGMGTPAQGLALDPPKYIRQTAVGLAAHGANTGALAMPSDPTLLFGENMPTIDGNGNVSNSWMMYKLLLAIPQPPPVVDAGGGPEEAGASDAGLDASLDASPVDASPVDASPVDASPVDASPVDGGVADGGEDAGTTPTPPMIAPLNVTQVYAPFQITDLVPSDRAVLNNYVQGLPMPIPFPGTVGQTGTMTLNELELMSLWISQGTQVPATCSQ